jgi:hypothetical protein
VLAHVPQASGRQRRVQRQVAGAGPQRAEQTDHQVDAARQEQPDEGLGADPALDQTGRGGRGTRGKFPEGEDGAVADECRAVRVGRGHRFEPIDDRVPAVEGRAGGRAERIHR